MNGDRIGRKNAHFGFEHLTLRLQLALWTSSLFVVLCLGLVLFINAITLLTGSRQLFAVSALGFLLVTIGGGFGAYWIAGRALRPVKNISVAAAQISASTLSTRLALDGPDDELRELAQAFDAMLDRLERAFEQQSRFVADAAHELRTPLTTLHTNLEVMRRDSQATIEEYQRLFATVERSLSRLESLVSNLLVLATEEQSLACEPVEVGSLLEEALADLQTMATTRQVSLRLQMKTAASLYGDEHLLMLVFRNLIENAIRYNHPGGDVTVTATDSPTQVVVRVADTGIGIAKEEQPHVFERFYRVDQSRSRHRGGAGLGLSIVQHILQLHSGSVSLEDNIPCGSVFQICLPVYPSSQHL